MALINGLSVLPFSKNWNNKLNAVYFTTFRLYNPSKHFLISQLAVTLNGSYLYNVEIIKLSVLKLNEIGELFSYLDAGMNREDFISMIKKMYPVENLFDKNFCILLCKQIC